jgi:hypothetical protein
MGDPMTNGEPVSSQFLSHLASYPTVDKVITTFKQNPYGAKSLELADSGYSKFAKPYVPYFSKPYGYVAPYVAKADSLGDMGLSKVDETFPIVKEDTEKIKSTVFDYAGYPFKLAGDGKTYLVDTYSSEYKKCGGDGYVAAGKAVISSGLVITSESLAWFSAFFQAKKEEAKKAYEEKTSS